MKLFIFLFALFGFESNAQLDMNSSQAKKWIGHATDQSTNCELTLAPSNSRKNIFYAYLKVNDSQIALGNSETGNFEIINEINQTVPNVDGDIHLYTNIQTGIAEPNLNKNIFLFIKEDGTPKLIKGVLFRPDTLQVKCGHFSLT